MIICFVHMMNIQNEQLLQLDIFFTFKVLDKQTVSNIWFFFLIFRKQLLNVKLNEQVLVEA